MKIRIFGLILSFLPLTALAEAETGTGEQTTTLAVLVDWLLSVMPI